MSFKTRYTSANKENDYLINLLYSPQSLRHVAANDPISLQQQKAKKSRFFSILAIVCGVVLALAIVAGMVFVEFSDDDDDD